MAGVKQIRAARVVVLRLDGVDAATAAERLQRLGMVHAVGLSSATELSVHIEGGKVDVVVIAASPLPSTGVDASPAGLLPPPAAAIRAGIPCLLLVDSMSRTLRRSAMACGYAAVMGVDSAPRLIYRRVGALMQRVRRLGRARAAPDQIDAPDAAALKS
ncbi:MAG: hypothetical protein FD152_1507 [Xanthobacteraceae bacterium]|nr:MAG: hypothetical protein FD152_1507 [Xanthobacteraceae bacterium]